MRCYDFFMRFVLPRSMVVAGEPFDNTDPLRFMNAFSQAWTEARHHVEGTTEPSPVEYAPAPEPEGVPQENAVDVDTFREALLVQVGKLPQDALLLMLQQAQEGKIEGWKEFTVEEKGIVLEVLGSAVLAVAEPAKKEEKKEEKVEKVEKVAEEAPPQVTETTAPAGPEPNGKV